MEETVEINTGESVATEVDVTTEDVTVNTENSGNKTEEQPIEQTTQEEKKTDSLDVSAINFPDNVSVSDEDKIKFSETLNTLGITTQEGAQKFADWVFELSKQGNEQLSLQQKEAEEKATQEWETIKKGWKESLQSDADFGREYDLNIKRANDTLVKFGGSELINWLKSSDLMEQPALLKTFARIGKEIEDARLIGGKAETSTNRVQRDRYGQPMITYKD